MGKSLTVHPRLTVLSDDQIRHIHSESLKILSSVGVRIECDAALKLCARTMGAGAVDGRVVRIPAEWVDWALAAAPSSVEIYDRTGVLAFRLPGPMRFGIGVTALHYLDPATGRTTPFARRHMQASVRLGHCLDSFDAVSTVGIVQDVPLPAADLYAALEMTANTTKPLVMLVSEDGALPVVFDLMEELHGDLAAKPFLIPFFNPVTPLVINRGTVDKMRWTAARGLPFVFYSGGLAGATTPITPGGTFVLLNAELLAGLVLSQLIREGTSVFLGMSHSVMGMRTMEPVADVRRVLMNAACAEMMAHYEIPHFGVAHGPYGWGANVPARWDQWVTHVMGCIGHGGLAAFVGDIFTGMVFSPQLVVFADEVIHQARLFARGFDLTNSEAEFEEIAAAGPGGNFLSTDLTLAHFRKAVYQSRIFPHATFEAWQAGDVPSLENVLARHTIEMIADLKPPVDHNEVLQRGEVFLAQSGRLDVH